MGKKKTTTGNVKKNTLVQQRDSQKKDFYIVGIGASAGGYEAIEKFFTNMPSDSGLAFIIVQHLSPDFKSLMVELLSKHTDMEVVRVEDGMEIQPNYVYLIPPKKTMTLYNGKLYLAELARGQVLNLPINIFLRSLAEEMQDRAIGIILSGTGSDGTLGIRDIKGIGGTVFVQDPQSSKFDGMPASAIATGLVDFVMPPEEMPKEIVRYVNHLSATKTTTSRIIDESRRDSLSRILQAIKQKQKMDFSFYKPSTIVRRIEKRMGINLIDEIEDYIKFLRDNPEEVKILSEELLIGVTKYFRDPEVFEQLQTKHLDRLFEGRKNNQPLRVWTAGCSTGEEAYSIAIMFREYLKQKKYDFMVKIFATDIDKKSLEVASAGVYPDSIAADVPNEYLSKYFTRKGASYRVNDIIREMVIFAPHNLIKDPPFNKIDLLVCRNLLIYLQAEAQKKVFSYFHFALNADAMLLLGRSESIGEMTGYFRSLDTGMKLYRKIGGTSPGTIQDYDVRPKVQLERVTTPLIEKRHSEEDINFIAVYKALIKDFEPAAVLVGADNDVEFVFGRAQEYLSGMKRGKVTLDIVKLVREDLSVATGTALHKARKEKHEVIYKDILLREEENPRRINLIVRHVDEDLKGPNHLLVVFNEISEESPERQSQEGETYNQAAQTDQRIKDLEQELQLTKENLQATVEELETSNEELQATNEELLASNEELQSTNEELQSVNEELITVNAEYQSKIEELTDLTNDYDNLLASTDIGTLFLDTNLRIRKFTPHVNDLISIKPSDTDRSISDLSLGNLHRDFISDLNEVKAVGNKIEKEIYTKDDQWYFVRIIPYLVEEGELDGLVVTFINITSRKKAEAKANSALQMFIDNSPAVKAIKDLDGKYKNVNTTFVDIFLKGRKKADIVTDSDLFPEHPDIVEMFNKRDREILKKKKSTTYIEELPVNGEMRFFETSRYPVFDEEKEIESISIISFDITDRIASERKVEAVRLELKIIVDSALQAFWVLTPEGIVEMYNKRASDLLKTISGKRLREGDRLKNKFIESAGKRFQQYLEEALKGKEVKVQENFSAKTRQKNDSLHYTFFPVCDKSGNVLKVCVSAFDAREFCSGEG